MSVLPENYIESGLRPYRPTGDFDHLQLGKQMWHFVYPPTNPTDTVGFEDELSKISLEKIEPLLAHCQELKDSLDNRIVYIKTFNKPGSIEEDWLRIWAICEFAEYYLIQKWLVYWTKLWRLATNKPLPQKLELTLNRFDDQDIERARQVSIEPYYEGRLRNVGGRLMGLCPFHEEKTPSFCIFPEGRGYYCFGCSQSGDSISFLMKTKGYSFPEAVRQLI